MATSGHQNPSIIPLDRPKDNTIEPKTTPIAMTAQATKIPRCLLDRFLEPPE